MPTPTLVFFYLVGLKESQVDPAAVYEDVGNIGEDNIGNDNCVTIISVTNVGHAPSSAASFPSSPTPTNTTLGSETSSDRGSFTINSITRSHGQSCGCDEDDSSNRYQRKPKELTNAHF